MTFKKFLESLTVDGLHTHDIYNFYTLSYLWQTTSDNRKEIAFEIEVLKDIWLDAFKPLVINQLDKYLGRGRLDDGSYKPEDLDISTRYFVLNNYMQSTFRSDMTRRNDVWNNLTEYLSKLEQVKVSDDVIFLIDRINNIVHNTGTTILDKFRNYNSIIEAFNECHIAKDPKQYLSKTKDIKYLFES